MIDRFRPSRKLLPFAASVLRQLQLFSTVAFALLAIVFGASLACGQEGPEQAGLSAQGSPSSDLALARRVRAILSNRCFACHGPDEDERQGGFRLDVRDSFLGAADSGMPPVTPGDLEASELLARIESSDESERMPPPDFGGVLAAEETELIRRWILDGAELPEHWSFVAPVRPALPQLPPAEAVVAADWQEHPIDRFVHAQQLAHGLIPSREASRFELLRRLSLDLTGLPPTPEETRAFVRDDSSTAYEKQVDRLLASPAYGEHWARKWLDLARYADSAGYADDPARTIWAYRDWVIRALNANMPIDEFTVAQIAGDLLPNPTVDDLVATAFHRNTLTNNEGGTNDEEFRNVAVVDRVNTTMAVWMGVTMACAQCHTHKYDPFTHEEYFQLFAIFNQSQDADRRDESPRVDVLTDEQSTLQKQWLSRLGDIESDMQVITPEVSREFDSWEHAFQPPAWAPLMATSFQTTSMADASATHPDGSIFVAPLEKEVAKDDFQVQFDLTPLSTGDSLAAIRLETIPDARLPSNGAGLAGGNFVLTNLSATVVSKSQEPLLGRYVRVELPGENRILSLAEAQVFTGTENAAIGAKASQASTAFGGEADRAIDGMTVGEYTQNSTTHTAAGDDPWWELDLGEVVSMDRVVFWNRTDGDLYTRLNGAKFLILDSDRNVLAEELVSTAPESHGEMAMRRSRTIEFDVASADFSQSGFAATAAIDDDPESGWAVGGQVDKPHYLTLVPKHEVEISSPAEMKLNMEFQSAHKNHVLASFRVAISSSRSARDWELLGPRLRTVVGKSRNDREEGEQAELVNFFARHLAAGNELLRSEKLALQEKLARIKPETSVPVMREVAANQRRETFVQIRGNYKSLGPKVTAGTPSVFHPLDRGQEVPSRLELARWLVDRRNPLTARVWMNRIWESLFGLGIVRSSEEFGSQGDRPSHPALLDWLACELMDSGWDQKAILRRIVMSKTYRQTSEVDVETLEIDQDNVWLARGPRVRLSAEMVRDQALAAAGLLAHKMYGPPVRPPQPDMGLKAAFGSATDWKPSEGEDRFRRGLYTTWRRSNPYPSMATFDAPSREVCTLRRESTNTPLQALVTLNDPGFVEAAQALARRVVSLGQASDAQQLARLFEYCTSRVPSDDEQKALVELLELAREQLAADPAAATKLATLPLGPVPKGADVVELAAYTAVCNVLLNLDEVLMKR